MVRLFVDIGVVICGVSVILFFFFKQKTAYEMRISDWSSDVCSSDLNNGHSNDGSGANGTSFAPIDAASTDAAKRAVIGTDFATIAGKTRETGYVTILRSGERRGSSADLNTFGQIVDDSHTPIPKDRQNVG